MIPQQFRARADAAIFDRAKIRLLPFKLSTEPTIRLPWSPSSSPA
jgi:hypothetical protein